MLVRQGELRFARKASARFTGAAPHGWKDASLDPEQIKKWWKRWPSANIGIACGPSGIVVIDIDVEKGGEETWVQIKRNNPTIRDSAVQAITQSRGRHLYYAAIPGVSITNGKAERLRGRRCSWRGWLCNRAGQSSPKRGIPMGAIDEQPDAALRARLVASEPESKKAAKPRSLPVLILKYIARNVLDAFHKASGQAEFKKRGNEYYFHCSTQTMMTRTLPRA